MTPNDIITQVANISAGEDSPDSADTARILRYVNNGYRQVYRQVAKINKNKLLTAENVSITSGSGTMTVTPLSIERVVDTTTDEILKEADIEWIEKYLDADIDDTGSPEYFYWDGAGTTLKTFPLNTTTVRVRYLPAPTDLTSAGAETTISLPVAYHDILVEAALFYMYQDENDIRSAQEIQVAKFAYEEKLKGLMRYLVGQPRGNRRHIRNKDF